jgi:hypothetical protein
MKSVHNAATFEPVADFPGTEAMFSYHLFRLRPQPQAESSPQ